MYHHLSVPVLELGAESVAVPDVHLDGPHSSVLPDLLVELPHSHHPRPLTVSTENIYKDIQRTSILSYLTTAPPRSVLSNAMIPPSIVTPQLTSNEKKSKKTQF